MANIWRRQRAAKVPRWNEHPAVSTDLSFGEKSADLLKRGFGTWTALGCVGLAILVWIVLQKTGFHWDLYPFILLNLCLSCLAAVQGIILQISANRGDRVSSEVALHTAKTADEIITMQRQLLDLQNTQMVILDGLGIDRPKLAEPSPEPSE